VLHSDRGRGQGEPSRFSRRLPLLRRDALDRWRDEIRPPLGKSQKTKGSLDDFLAKEQKRQSEFDRKFDATFELQKEKHHKADELFKKALEKAEKGKDEDQD
jgi:hypothetical protein